MGTKTEGNGDEKLWKLFSRAFQMILRCGVHFFYYNNLELFITSKTKASNALSHKISVEWFKLRRLLCFIAVTTENGVLVYEIYFWDWQSSSWSSRLLSSLVRFPSGTNNFLTSTIICSMSGCNLSVIWMYLKIYMYACCNVWTIVKALSSIRCLVMRWSRVKFVRIFFI